MGLITFTKKSLCTLCYILLNLHICKTDISSVFCLNAHQWLDESLLLLLQPVRPHRGIIVHKEKGMLLRAVWVSSLVHQIS